MNLSLVADANPIRILVSWRPDSDGVEAIEFAAWLSRTTNVVVRVIGTYMRLWPATSRSKQSSKYKKWHAKQANNYAARVKQALRDAKVDKSSWDADYAVFADGMSEASMLTEAADNFSAHLVILGAEATAPKGRFRAGSIAETLLHSSPHPLGLAPRAVKLSKHGVTRVNVAFLEADHEEHEQLLIFAAKLALRWHVPLRLVAFSPLGLTEPSDKTTLDVARNISDEWHEYTLSMFDRARDVVMEAVPDVEVSSALGAGAGWAGAVDSMKWKKGDLVCLGSVQQGPFERVFIGSTEAEFLRHVRVPVILNPTARL